MRKLGLIIVIAAGITDFARPAHAMVRLNQKLDAIRTRVIHLEGELLETARKQTHVQRDVGKIQEIMKLQKEEAFLTGKRVDELNAAVQSLETRRSELRVRLDQRRESVRKNLVTLLKTYPALAPDAPGTELPEAWKASERVSMPARRMITGLTDLSLKDIEAFRVDLADADGLEEKLQIERAQLVYLSHDLDEQRNVLELNRQVQLSILARNHEEKVERLAAYRALKSAESQVETLLSEFNARSELTRTVEAEKAVSVAFNRGEFARLRGKLAMPLLGGSIISSFGQVFDPRVKMSVFRKGIEIAPAADRQVRSVGAGKVAFAGELPDYGKVTIIDHGDHYYTLLGRMGELARRTGDAVAAGEIVGRADTTGSAVYFEVRMRNVAVNPLQWISN